MSKSNTIFRKIFLQKKLFEFSHQYPYTYIFQYNNISSNDWKKIKYLIHKIQNKEKMNVLIVPSKLRKNLQGESKNSLHNFSLFFSNIKGPCCVLNCYNPADLNIFYKIIHQSLENQDLNIKLSTHSTSFLHLALQLNSKNKEITLFSNESNNILNFLEIENTVLLNSNEVYQKFFSTIHSNLTQCISFPTNYYNQLDFMLKNQKSKK